MNTAHFGRRDWRLGGASAAGLVVALVLAVLAVTLIPAASAQEPEAGVTEIAQAVPGAVINLSQDGSEFAQNLQFGDQATVATTSGLTNFTATDATTGAIVFGPINIALPSVASAIVLHPSANGDVTLSVVPWDLSPISAGQGRLVLGHGAPLPATTVTITGEGGYSTSSQLANGQSLVLDLDPGVYTIGFAGVDGQSTTSLAAVSADYVVAAWVTGLSASGLLIAQLGRSLDMPAVQAAPNPFMSKHSLRATAALAFVPVFVEPNGESFTLEYEYLDGGTIEYPLTNPTYFGNDLVLAVTQGAPGDEWAEVLLPVRPLGTTGWIMTAGLEWVFHDKTVHAFVEDSTVMVANGLGPIWEFPVEVGRSDRPTPLGTTYIDELLVPAPSPAYGAGIISLAMYSESISSFSGGLPKISINGTSSPHGAGAAGTSGSLRIRDAEFEFLIELLGPNVAGTPLTVWPSRAEFEAAVGSPTCGGRTPTVNLALGQTPTAGDDVIVGTAGADIIVGGTGNDVICGMGGDDQIWGQAGNDVVYAGDGDDKVRGGDGHDTLYGDAGSDDLNGGRDNDVVRGGAGDDAAVRGGTGDDVVMGDDGNDPIVAGNGGSDMVIGGAGNDKVTGGPRPDRVAGGAGNDELKGNKGADLLFGEAGDDQLFGGPQSDELHGGQGNNSCNGGTEIDEILFSSCQVITAVP